MKISPVVFLKIASFFKFEDTPKGYFVATLISILKRKMPTEYHYSQLEGTDKSMYYKRGATHVTLNNANLEYGAYRNLSTFEFLNSSFIEDFARIKRFLRSTKPKNIITDNIQIIPYIKKCDHLKVIIQTPLFGDLDRNTKTKCPKLSIVIKDGLYEMLRYVIRCVDVDHIVSLYIDANTNSVIEYTEENELNDDGLSFIRRFEELCGQNQQQEEEGEEEEGEEEEEEEVNSEPDEPEPDRMYDPEQGDPEENINVIESQSSDDEDVPMQDEDVPMQDDDEDAPMSDQSSDDEEDFLRKIEQIKEAEPQHADVEENLFQIHVEDDEEEEGEDDELCTVNNESYEKKEYRVVDLSQSEHFLLSAISYLVNRERVTNVIIKGNDLFDFKMFTKDRFRDVTISNLGFLNSFDTVIDNLYLVDFYQQECMFNKESTLKNALLYNYNVLEISPLGKLKDCLFQIIKEPLMVMKINSLVIRNVKNVYHLLYFMKAFIVNNDIIELCLFFKGRIMDDLDEYNALKNFITNMNKSFMIDFI